MDREQSLSGYCDFLISLSPEQLFLRAPVIALVEAKNENLIGGLGQCVAEMLAARLFNEREGHPLASVYGAVATGTAWKFVKLAERTVYLDLKDYSLEDQPDKVVGILSAMVKQAV